MKYSAAMTYLSYQMNFTSHQTFLVNTSYIVKYIKHSLRLVSYLLYLANHNRLWAQTFETRNRINENKLIYRLILQSCSFESIVRFSRSKVILCDHKTMRSIDFGSTYGKHGSILQYGGNED